MKNKYRIGIYKLPKVIYIDNCTTERVVKEVIKQVEQGKTEEINT